MILREIDMDLPYIRGIDQEQLSENDIKEDYQLNWKWKRRQFQLTTRCMTAMIERIMPRITTKDCKKLLIECVYQPSRNSVINLSGLYCVQVPFEVDRFWEMGNLEKKIYIIRKIKEALMIISQNNCFDVAPIENACDEVINNGYLNEWYWKKPVKSKQLSAQIKIIHELESVRLYVVFKDLLKNVQKEKFLVSALPDEFVYSQYLGKLEWISEEMVKLTTKSGEGFIEKYE